MSPNSRETQSVYSTSTCLLQSSVTMETERFERRKVGERGRLNSCTVQMDGLKDGSNYYNTEFKQYVFNNINTPLASHGSLKVVTQEMFMSQTFDKPKDVAATVGTLKCQLLIVLHVCVNSGQMSSLKDKIITHKFDSSRLMAWPLKCHLPSSITCMFHLDETVTSY